MKRRNQNPHFFKPLLQDFLINFSIPKSFAKHLDDDHDHDDHKIARLRVRREKAYWEVKINIIYYEEIKDDQVQYFFKDGWDKFCIHHGFQVGDFLVFQHLGSFVFELSVFDPSFCERKLSISSPSVAEPSSSAHPVHGKEGSKTRSTIKTTFKPRGYPYYQAIVKSYWPRSGMILSKKFAREIGVDKESLKMIIMVDPKGEPWKLALKHYSMQSCIIGWGPFHVANSLKHGQNVVFELLDFRANHAIINFYELT